MKDILQVKAAHSDRVCAEAFQRILFSCAEQKPQSWFKSGWMTDEWMDDGWME